MLGCTVAEAHRRKIDTDTIRCNAAENPEGFGTGFRRCDWTSRPGCCVLGLVRGWERDIGKELTDWDSSNPTQRPSAIRVACGLSCLVWSGLSSNSDPRPFSVPFSGGIEVISDLAPWDVDESHGAVRRRYLLCCTVLYCTSHHSCSVQLQDLRAGGHVENSLVWDEVCSAPGKGREGREASSSSKHSVETAYSRIPLWPEQRSACMRQPPSMGERP